MLNHLTDDEIEMLLQPAYGGGFDMGSGAGTEAARRHVYDCMGCGARLRAQRSVLHQLHQLTGWSVWSSDGGPRDDSSESDSDEFGSDRHDPAGSGSGSAGYGATQSGAHCPPEDIWDQIAAGAENEDAEISLSHAIHCEHCGRLLSRAAAAFSEDLTEEEEERLAALASATPAWQARLAAVLARNPEQSAARAPAFWETFAVFASPIRVGLAAAVLAAVVLGVQDYRLQARLSAESGRDAAEIRQLESSTAQEEAQIAGMQGNGEQPSPAGALAKAPAATQDRVAAQDRIATLVLEPGLTRGSGEMKRLTQPAGAEAVRVVLHLPQGGAVGDVATGPVRAELKTVDGKAVWSAQFTPVPARPEQSSPTTNQGPDGSIALLIPAYLLTPDDYELVLSHLADSDPEIVATYSFRVPR